MMKRRNQVLNKTLETQNIKKNLKTQSWMIEIVKSLKKIILGIILLKIIH
jgi:hypothetical protein